MSTLKRKQNSNEIIVNNKSNFKSHLIKCQNILDSVKHNEVVIRAMGKATIRAANLALQLNNDNYNTFQIKSETYTVDVAEDRSLTGRPIRGADKDGFDPDALDSRTQLYTHIPALVIRVRRSEFEIKALAAARKRGLLEEDRH